MGSPKDPPFSLTPGLGCPSGTAIWDETGAWRSVYLSKSLYPLLLPFLAGRWGLLGVVEEYLYPVLGQQKTD